MNRLFLTVLVLGLGGSAAVWSMYRTGLSFLRPWWTALIFLVMPLLFVFSNVYLNLLPRSITRFLAWLSGLWAGFWYYSILTLLVFLLVWLVGWVGHFPKAAPMAARLLFALNLVVVVVGCWRATHPVVREETYHTDLALSAPYKVVFVSDLHYGGLFGRADADRMVQRINSLKPDLVLLGGDMVDGNLLLVQKEGTLDALKNLQSRDGVYAVYGNHDRRMGTGPLERKMLEQDGIHFLVDENQEVNPQLSLTGLDDYLFGDRRVQFAPAPGKFNIFLEHEPRHIEEAAKAGYNLYFAGHTHAGQLFPNRLITKKMYFLDYGSQKVDQLLATVSSGYGLWGIPVRTGPMPEIVVVNIEK